MMRLMPLLSLALAMLTTAHSAHAAGYPLPTIYVLDLNSVSSLPADQRYDIRHAAACIQVLANRTAPRVFIHFQTADAQWLAALQEPGGLCEGWPVQTVSSIDQLLTIFRSYVSGVIAYDPDPNTGVISTSLAATTA